VAIELQKTLSELSDLLPIVPLRVSELMEAGQALRRRAEDVLERVDELPDAAEDLRGALEQTARDAVDELREAHEERSRRLQDLQDGASQLSESLAQWSQELDDATDAARTCLCELEKTFAEDGELSGCEGQSATSADAAATRHLASVDRFRLIQEGYRKAHERLRAGIGQCTSLLASAFADSVERVQEMQEQVDQGIDALKDTTEEAHEELGDALATTIETMAESLDEAAEAFTDLVSRQQLEAARGRIRQTYARAVENGRVARAAGGGADGIQNRLEPLFDGVSALLHPVEAAVDAVRAAASLVGLNLH
jgi:uncharacterized coiled-coil DUF342 family protein